MTSTSLRRFPGLLAGVVLLALGGCAVVPRAPLVHQPMTAAAEAPSMATAAHGSVYGGAGGLALFEDQRPRGVGDILTIVISERVDASKNSGASASRDASVGAAFDLLPKFLVGLLRDQDAQLSGSNTLDAKGRASAANTFNGVITVTVTDVLPNGNLRVSGEKQVGINQGTEFIRFSGVVNPRTVTGSSNTVRSTQVADARIEYTAKGYIDEAQHMGWLQRFFLNVGVL